MKCIYRHGKISSQEHSTHVDPPQKKQHSAVTIDLFNFPNARYGRSSMIVASAKKYRKKIHLKSVNLFFQLLFCISLLVRRTSGYHISCLDSEDQLAGGEMWLHAVALTHNRNDVLFSCDTTLGNGINKERFVCTTETECFTSSAPMTIYHPLLKVKTTKWHFKRLRFAFMDKSDNKNRNFYACQIPLNSPNQHLFTSNIRYAFYSSCYWVFTGIHSLLKTQQRATLLHWVMH